MQMKSEEFDDTEHRGKRGSRANGLIKDTMKKKKTKYEKKRPCLVMKKVQKQPKIAQKVVSTDAKTQSMLTMQKHSLCTQP